MRFKHKKLFISGTAVAAAGALGVGAFLQTVLSVQASSDMMPGIEQIVSENTEEEPFKILELVDNSGDAEIGYYISGQEPTLKLYEYQYTDQSGNEQKVHFSSVQEALSKLPEKYRTEFMMNVKVNDDGTIDSNSSTGIKKVGAITGDNSSEYPLFYSDYKEKYFLESGDDADSWNKVDIVDFDGKSRTDTVQVNGSYQANTSGTGNYTKADQEYYPIRNDVDSDKNQPEKFRENIQSFYPSEGSDSRGAYYLEFAEVSNDKINSALEDENKKKNEILPEYDYANGRYGYYENVYTDLTKEITDNINSGNYQFAGENPDAVEEGAVEIQKNENEAVQSNISESNAFSSGEDNNSATVDSSSDGQDDFSVDEGSDSGSVDFDNAYPSDEFDNGDLDGGSFDSDISLEQQSYEVPADSSDTDVFSDDFSNQTVISDDSGNMADAQTSDEQDTSAFDEYGTDAETADPTGEDVDEQSDQRIAIGRIDNDSTAGSQGNPYIYLGKNIDEYPYYQYELIGDLEYVQNKIGEVENEVKNDPDRGYIAGDIILENDQYWYYGSDENGTVRKYPLLIVTGRQPVSYNELQTIPPDKIKYNYYYRVEKVYFCCKSVDNSQEDPSACAYFGWYYPTYPENEDAYIPVEEGKNATHYISEAVYNLTPGTGNYDFVPGGDTSYQVQVNSFYYQGGYSNNDWFKKYVFHLDPKVSDDEDEGEFEKFGIEVDTRSASDVTSAVYAAVSGEDTAGQSITVDDTASADDAGNSADESAQNDAADVDFTSEYQEPDTQDAGESVDMQDVGETEDATVAENTGDSANISESIDNESQEDSGEASSDETKAEVSEAAESEEESAADAGDGETTNAIADVIADYDLVDVNVNLSQEVAEALADAVTTNKVPCIVNTEKADLSATSALGGAFESLIKNATDDTDGHYVNTCVYFFKNIFDSENGAQNLVNKDFCTEFNETQSEGFEEIISYIESENEYRQLEIDGNNSTNSDDEINDGSDRSNENNRTQSIELLTKELSQARVIEYIINYKYKRNILAKNTLNVLEIMPDVNCNELSDDTLKKWLNVENSADAAIEEVKIASATANCWHGQDNGSTPDAPEYVLNNNENQIWHSKWAVSNENSECYKHTHYLELDFEKESTVNGFKYLGRQDGNKAGTLVRYKVEFYDGSDKKIDETEGVTGISSSNYRTIGEVQLSFGKTYSSVKKVRIYFLDTLGGFASCAHISFFYDPNGAFAQIKSMTASEFVGHMDDIGAKYDLIYIGDKIQQKYYNYWPDIKNLDTTDKTSYLITGPDNYRYTHVGAGIQATKSTEHLLKMLGQLDNEYDSWVGTGDIKKRFAPLSTFGPDSGGYFRGSGNDMTEQQYNELLDFVKSGYPVVIGSSLVNNDRSINSSTVDSSSWYYQFITTALKYDNVFVKSELDNNSKDISFFTGLAKPVIKFAKDGEPKEPPRLDETNDGSYGYINGELKFKFSIDNDSDASPAITTYDCNLYIDLNFDGNLSSKEAQDKYIQIQDADGNVLSQSTDKNGKQRYELKPGKEYTLIRKIPQDYYKLITWKLEVSSNRNSYIHTSVTGYAKQKNNTGTKQKINVLQLLPNRDSHWNLKTDETFKSMISEVEDFDIDVETISVDTINNYNYNEVQSILKDKQMLVLGFADVYQDIKNNNGQVNAILDFVKSGKSIIFAHDTTSYVNYDYDKMEKKIVQNNYEESAAAYVYNDTYLGNRNNRTWGYSLNTVLRSVVGMDRYGITSTEQLENGKTLSEVLKEGKSLDGDSVSFKELMKIAGDVAYTTGDSRNSSYGQTQAYTNTMINQIKTDGSAGSQSVTTKATKVNDGAITQYPYKMESGLPLSIATTHGQYYQLALEQDSNDDGANDIVVWYCLSGGYYSNSPNDVRNNYYFYSKGNVIYTGAGHDNVNGREEIKLFINAMVAAANVTAVEPEVHFVKSLNPAAETETSRYYMTDQSSWTSGEPNTLEKDMTYYINVRDYNMVSADLNQDDLDKQEMTVQFYIDDSNGDKVEGCPASGNVSDITANVGSLTGYGNIGTITLGDDRKFHLSQNSAYGLQVADIEQYLRSQNGSNGYKEACKLYVKVTSTVYLYGQEKTSTVWSSIDLKQRQLFEMD